MPRWSRARYRAAASRRSTPPKPSAAPGVRAVLTHRNAPRLPYRDFEHRPPVDPKSGQQLRVLQGPEVLFSGQPVAAVVADTREQAQHAASLVRVHYDMESATTTFDPARRRASTTIRWSRTRPSRCGRASA